VKSENKPNTNPIQTQFKANFGPKIRVAKPNKANSNPNKPNLPSVFSVQTQFQTEVPSFAGFLPVRQFIENLL
jgi:hypothetical protein